MTMKVIVGLGNPEKKYDNTYHNLGFIVADNVAKRFSLDYKLNSSLKCAVAKGTVDGKAFLVIKPTTYMNLSGECVKRVVDYYGVELNDLLVVYDDIDVEPGKIKFRPHGSPGTHNGMRNITLLLGTAEFKRLRIGTKPKNDLIPLADYVLSKIPKEEYGEFNFAIDKAGDLIVDYLKGKSDDDLMQLYNKRN